MSDHPRDGWRWALRFLSTDHRPADFRCFACRSLFRDHLCHAPGPFAGYQRGKDCPECGSLWGPEHACAAANPAAPSPEWMLW